MKLPQHSLRELLLLVALAAMGCGTAPVKNTLKPTLADFQGKWRIVSLVGDGEAAPAEDLRIAGFVMAVEGDRFTARNGNGKLYSTGHIVIHESTTPTEVDFVGDSVEGRAETTKVGIIRINGGRLNWCFAHAGSSRPTGFAAPAASEGNKSTLAEFERIK